MAAPNIVTSAMNLTAVASGAGRMLLSFYVALAQVVDATDLMTAFPLTFKGRLLAIDWVTHTKVTTADALATLSATITRGTVATAVTGGVVALTSALCTPEGTPIAGSAITALNTFASGDFLTLSWSSVTPFTEGTGRVLVTVENLDTTDAIARAMLLFNP